MQIRRDVADAGAGHDTGGYTSVTTVRTGKRGGARAASQRDDGTGEPAEARRETSVRNFAEAFRIRGEERSRSGRLKAGDQALEFGPREP